MVREPEELVRQELANPELHLHLERYALRLIPPHLSNRTDRVEELVQDTCIRALSAASHYSPAYGSVRSWIVGRMYSIMGGRITEQKRRERIGTIKFVAAKDGWDEGVSPPPQMDILAVKEILRANRSCGKLPRKGGPTDAQVLLASWMGWTFEEIAQALGRSRQRAHHRAKEQQERVFKKMGIKYAG